MPVRLPLSARLPYVFALALLFDLLALSGFTWATEAKLPNTQQKGAPRVGGFVDAQARWENAGRAPDFRIEDAAVYLEHGFGKVDVLIDLPFQTSGSGNSFAFATRRTQAFLSGGREKGGLYWQVGQWDTPFGFEANDTIQLPLTRQGLVFSQLLPQTHTGALLRIEPSGDLAFTGMLSDPADHGAFDGDAPELAVQACFTGSALHLSLGLRHRGENGRDRFAFEGSVGTRQGPVSFDLQLDAVDPRNGESQASSLALFGNWSVTDRLGIAVRAESLSDSIADGISLARQRQLTFGPQLTVDGGLKLRSDVTLTSVLERTGAPERTAMEGAVSAAYRF